MPGVLEHLIQRGLHLLPDGVTVRLYHHASPYRGMLRQTRLVYQVVVPLGVIHFFARQNLCHKYAVLLLLCIKNVIFNLIRKRKQIYKFKRSYSRYILIMKKLVYITAIGSFLLGSCAAPKLAQESVDDDFYAKEYTPEESYAAQPAEEEAYGDEEYAYRRSYEESYEDDSYGSYTSRLRRFHSPFYGFSYFDYYDPFFYDPWFRPGFNLGLSFGWGGYYGYRPWGYYSYSPYYYSPFFYYATPYFGYNYARYGGYWGGYHPGYYYSRPIYRPSGIANRPRPRVGSVNDG